MALYPPNQPGRDEPISGISLCAGAGALDLGISLAEPRYRTVCFVERDAFAAVTLLARMADASLEPAPLWEDVKSFDGTPWRGKIHLLTAGYPCQPFSYCGYRKGTEDPRHLWPDIARIIREISPPTLFFENVPGHLTLGFREVAGELQEMGYRVAAGLFTAAETGASQLRERLFILAHADLPQFWQPGMDGDRASALCLPKRSDAGRKPVRAQKRRERMANALEPDAGGGLDGLPLYPPGPGEFTAWRDLLENRSAAHPAQPALHRLDDGMAHRMERSALAGQGVCPLQAAYAFQTLRNALQGG